jgi:predicted MFS family arabinose efflux permease
MGLSLAIGLTVGPYLAATLGIPFLFHATGVLSILAIGCVIGFLRPTRAEPRVPLTRRSVLEAFRRRELFVLNAGGFLLHLLVTFNFVVIPLALHEHLPWRRQWTLYPPVLIPAILLMWVVTQHADRRGWMRPLQALGALAVAWSSLLYARAPNANLSELVGGLIPFAAGVACLEPTLPALVTRFAPRAARGTAAAVFSVCQFAGASLGGLLGGRAADVGSSRFYAFIVASFLVWGVLAMTLPPERFREAQESAGS